MSKLFKDRFLFRIPEEQPPRDWHLEAHRMHRETFGSHADGQYTFLVNAGTGSGKTYLAALIAHEMLLLRDVDRLVYICPNKAIITRTQETFRKFLVHLTCTTGEEAADAHRGRKFPRTDVYLATALDFLFNPRGD